jgi:hypothetical protein
VGVFSVSCTEARLVNLTVWFAESVVGGAAKADEADNEAATATTPHASAMRMRDMHFLLGGLRSTARQAERTEEGEKGIVQSGHEFMTRLGELRARTPIRILQIGE